MAVVLLGGHSYGDVIPEDHHIVDCKVQITNTDSFPDVVIVSYTVGPMIPDYEVSVVGQEELSVGYKFDHLRLFALEKTAFDNAGGLNNINFKSLEEKITPADIVQPSPYTVENSNPLNAEEYYYRIEESTEGKVTLALEKRILKYRDGTEDRIEFFE